jgi:D-sedoheptulose 7-phosphate isomerase
MNWQEHIDGLHGHLNETVFTDTEGNRLSHDEFFGEVIHLTEEVRHGGSTAFFIGNGASASMSSHMAADFAKNGKVHTETFTDLALITAVANDISYDEVFRIPLMSRGKPGDILVSISSSGASPNILKATATARELGMTVVTLSGMNSENPLKRMGHLNAFVPAPTYGFVETAHAALLHFWMDRIQVPAISVSERRAA